MTYHIPIDIEHDEKFSYLVHRPTGRRFMIRGFSDARIPPLLYRGPYMEGGLRGTFTSQPSKKRGAPRRPSAHGRGIWAYVSRRVKSWNF